MTWNLVSPEIDRTYEIFTQLSQAFNTADGLMQGDPLASPLNIAPERGMSESSVDVSHTLYRRSVKIQASADNIDIG